MSGNLIEKYGRFKVHQIVSTFYDHVLSPPRLAPYFDGIDIQGLVDHQAAFLRSVMGGPTAHSPSQIEHAHRGLGVKPEDFEEMIGLLVKSLEKYEVEPADIDTIKGRYHEYQNAVIGAGQPDR